MNDCETTFTIRYYVEMSPIDLPDEMLDAIAFDDRVNDFESSGGTAASEPYIVFWCISQEDADTMEAKIRHLTRQEQNDES